MKIQVIKRKEIRIEQMIKIINFQRKKITLKIKNLNLKPLIIKTKIKEKISLLSQIKTITLIEKQKIQINQKF